MGGYYKLINLKMNLLMSYLQYGILHTQIGHTNKEPLLCFVGMKL